MPSLWTERRPSRFGPRIADLSPSSPNRSVKLRLDSHGFNHY